MKEWGASGKGRCGSKEKEKGEDVDKIKKEKETYGGKKKGKESEFTI